MKTKEEKNKFQKEYRLRNNNSCTKKYEKTINGFLMRSYRNMKSRILGIQWKKAHLYTGKEILSKEDFYAWSLSNKNFIKLFKSWEKSNYERRITPSIDRIDSSFGYYLENMQWVPFHVNCSRVNRNFVKTKSGDKISKTSTKGVAIEDSPDCSRLPLSCD